MDESETSPKLLELNGSLPQDDELFSGQMGPYLPLDQSRRVSQDLNPSGIQFSHLPGPKKHLRLPNLRQRPSFFMFVEIEF